MLHTVHWVQPFPLSFHIAVNSFWFFLVSILIRKCANSYLSMVPNAHSYVLLCPFLLVYCIHSYWSTYCALSYWYIVPIPIGILCPFLLVYCAHFYWSIGLSPIGLLCPFLLVCGTHFYWYIVTIPICFLCSFLLVYCAHSYWAMVLIPIGR